MLELLKCNKNSSLVDAWKIINENGKGIVFIVDDIEKLVGILTDGDIRRCLLNGGQLTAKLESIMNKDFTYAFIQELPTEIIQKITKTVKIIPIVNENKILVDFFEYRADINIPIAIPDLKGNEFNYLTEAFLSTWISSSGEYIKKFEVGFSGFCETKYGVAVSNGTVAIHLALITLGIGPGDEVIVPDLTFAASINAVLHASATPVIVDVEEDSWCIDPIEIEKAITPKTKAIIPVHLYGQPCDMTAIMNLAKKFDLFVIEDCAEAHGAEFDGKKVGSFGDISCFSFYGNKVITTGEGGMCITNKEEYYDKMKLLRDHGMSKTKRYWHDMVGYNYRLTNLQAAIGLAQLERIDEILENRRLIEENYVSVLSNSKIFEFQKTSLPNRKKITWLVSALVKNGSRDEVMNLLQDNGIDVRPFFYSLSQMEIYKKYVFSCRISNMLSPRGINFPTNNNVSSEVLKKISGILSKINN